MVAMAFQVCRELPDENYSSVNVRLHKDRTSFIDESVGLMDCPRKEEDDDS